MDKGQLLADIETPEVDQELMQAARRPQPGGGATGPREDLRRPLGHICARWTRWRSRKPTSERVATCRGKRRWRRATANVRRLEQLESFKHIYAPFSGVITKRNTDIGALINAGNSGTNQELFVVAQIDPIRVYVDVPEIDAPSVHRGNLKATIELPSLPGRRFSGSVARTANAIDPTTRTLRTEIDVPNPKGELASRCLSRRCTSR